MPDQQCQRWRGRQRRIGLTGGIASGKSTAARWLEAQGVPVLDADLFAREVLAPGTAGSEAVLARYGEAVCTKESSQPASVDRASLGRIVFSDPAERRWLESLVHPLVRERFTAQLNNCRRFRSEFLPDRIKRAAIGQAVKRSWCICSNK